MTTNEHSHYDRGLRHYEPGINRIGIPTTTHRYYSDDQDITFRMTSPEEETALFLKAKAGDLEAFTFVIQNHLLFALMQAQASVKGSLPRNEVISAANFAVMKAYQTFDPLRGFRFTTYLRPFIRGEVSALWRSKFSGGVADPSLAGGSGSSDRRTQNRGQLEGDADRGVSGDGLSWKRTLPDADLIDESVETFDQIDLRQFNQAALAKVLGTLSEKDGELIRLHYGEELSFAEIGRQRCVSREAIRATHERILDRLKKQLRAEGVASAV